MNRFATTRWSLILAASDASTAGPSLDALCRAYRAPVLAYLRSAAERGEDAEEQAQAFFTYFLEQRVYGQADPDRGRFRSYLLGAVRNFVSSQRRGARALKRGGGVADLGDEVLDSVTQDHPGDDPEAAFERQWALTLIARALTRLEAEAVAAGKGAWYAQLRDFITEAPDDADYERLAAALDVRRNTLAVAVHRLRQRLGELVQEELADTVASAADVDAEQRMLAAALRL